MVDDHDGIIHGVIDIVRLMHVSTMLLAYKMYYSLCWTQRCTIHYCMASVQVAACTYRNSVFFEFIFGHQSHDRCRLLILSYIDSAALNNDHFNIKEQDSIVVPMEISLQSTVYNADADMAEFYVVKLNLCISIVLSWYIHLLTVSLRFSPYFCNIGTFLVGGRMVDLHLFVDTALFCRMTSHDPQGTPASPKESKWACSDVLGRRTVGCAQWLPFQDISWHSLWIFVFLFYPHVQSIGNIF